MLIRVKKPNYSYKLMRPELTVTDEERDLEAMVNNLMKELTQCVSTGGKKRVSSVLGIIRNSIENRGACITILGLLDPHLVLSSHLWLQAAVYMQWPDPSKLSQQMGQTR